jgi:hypothetical protein
MRIVRIESFCTEFVGFVRVTAEDGGEGWGQLSTYHADISAQVLHRQVAPWVLGEATDDLGALLDTVAEREHKFPGPTSPGRWAASTPPSGICAARRPASRWWRCSAGGRGRSGPTPRR